VFVVKRILGRPRQGKRHKSSAIRWRYTHNHALLYQARQGFTAIFLPDSSPVFTRRVLQPGAHRDHTGGDFRQRQRLSRFGERRQDL
jgi:hypothetical protein